MVIATDEHRVCGKYKEMRREDVKRVIYIRGSLKQIHPVLLSFTLKRY